MYAEIIIDVSASEIDRIFDYACDDTICAGCRVLVPFGKGNKPLEGFVLRVKADTSYDKSKVKAVLSRLDEIVVINQELLQLASQIKYDYNLKMVDILRLFIPAQMRGGRIKELKRYFITISDKYKDKTTRDLIESKIIKPTAQNRMDVFAYLQQNGQTSLSQLSTQFSTSAIQALVESGVLTKEIQTVGRIPYAELVENKTVTLIQQQQDAINYINTTTHTTTVLHGITGSGKTEVYLNLIDTVLKNQKTAIMLVPEIGLTPQALRIFRSKFGNSVAILHSGLSAGERFDEWKRLLLGQASVAIGARSAIFAPLQEIGIIIIDEEHDSSYISESNPRYDTKEIAKRRAEYHKCKLVLGSATPSIESYHHTQIGEYGLVEMPKRINNQPLPPLDIVDMRQQVLSGNNSILSTTLLQAIDQTLQQNNKVMLFLNRRGYSSYVICKECGFVAKCSDCDVSLVYHKEENLLKCHFCNNRFAMLDLCPVCNSKHIRRGFVGTEQVVEQIEKHFPQVKVLRMDNDTTQKKDSHTDILGKFGTDEYNVLVGTQMIVKGHDFASVSLVGILDADMSLHFNDYRAVEKTFQLITQASGRAGRADIAGKVILQTYTPQHYVYKFAASGDYKTFFEKEYNLRETTQYPPFAVLIRILISGSDESTIQQTLKTIFDQINQIRTQQTSINAVHLSSQKEMNTPNNTNNPNNGEKIDNLTTTNQQSKPSNPFLYYACMRSPIKRIQNHHRMQILARLTIPSYQPILQQIYQITNPYNTTQTKIFVEINPSNLS